MIEPDPREESAPAEQSRLVLLENYCVELRQMCAFLHSVILCGEKWSEEDEHKYRSVVEP